MLDEGDARHDDAPIARAVVVGVGLMGRRIAGVLARSGVDVTLVDRDRTTLTGAVAEASEMAAGAGTVRGGTDLSVTATSDLVIEAITENLPAKQALFAELASTAPRALLATNTSVLPVTQIAVLVPDAGRVVGTHWWNPPDLIPIVEVTAGARTSAATTRRITAALVHWGKTPVLVRRDVPGFIGNRLQLALWREAMALVADGICDAESVDLVARNTIGLRLATMGPLENADYIGLELTRAIAGYIFPHLATTDQAPPLLTEMIDKGDAGSISGRGFLAWPAHARAQAAERLGRHISAQLADSALPSGQTGPDPS